METEQQQQPFYSPLFRTTRVSQYQKKTFTHSYLSWPSTIFVPLITSSQKIATYRGGAETHLIHGDLATPDQPPQIACLNFTGYFSRNHSCYQQTDKTNTELVLYQEPLS